MIENYSVHFGNLLESLRKERGLSQEAMAEAADISRKYLITLEKGRADPRLAVVLKLAQALGVSFSEFASYVERTIKANNS